MKIRKTPWGQRDTYTYVFADGEKVTLRPERDGITEADINGLHRADDAEVRNNIKNSRRPYTENEREQWGQWEDEHPGEKPLKNWHISFDSLTSTETGAPTSDRFAGYADVSTTMPYDEEEADCLGRLREIVNAATERQQQVYQLVVMEGYNFTQAGRILGISDVAVRKQYLALVAKIKDDPLMQSFFR